MLFFAAILAGLAVVLGAFGAHGLKAILAPDRLAIYETAVRYQFYHALAIFLAGLLQRLSPNSWIPRAAWFFIIGIFFFSGSIYLLACRDVLGIQNWVWLGPVTPLGGLMFIAGWLSLSVAAWQSQSND